jgi:hypothetical protein
VARRVLNRRQRPDLPSGLRRQPRVRARRYRQRFPTSPPQPTTPAHALPEPNGARDCGGNSSPASGRTGTRRSVPCDLNMIMPADQWGRAAMNHLDLLQLRGGQTLVEGRPAPKSAYRRLPRLDLIMWQPAGRFQARRPGKSMVSMMEMSRNRHRWLGARYDRAVDGAEHPQSAA